MMELVENTFLRLLPRGFQQLMLGLPQTPIKEVGVIYSTNRDVPEPSGWKLVRRDLNEDSGGYYIYICYRY